MQRSLGNSALAIAALLLVAGCASGPTVRTFSDPTVDWTQFQTFAFHTPLGTDRGGFQSVQSQQLMASSRREMEARGFRYDPENPQLLLNFGASLDERLDVTTVPAPASANWGGPWGSPWGWRSGFYQPWPTHPVNETRVTQYNEGTLTIDVVNPATRQMVWEGVISDRVTENMMRNPGPALDNAVTATFAKFPVPKKG